MNIKSMLLGLGTLFLALSVSAQDSSAVDPARAQVLRDGLALFIAAQTAATQPNDQQYTQALVAMAYVDGVSDAMPNTVVCAPPNVSRGQTVHIVLKYLDDHPGDWQLGSATMIIRALRTTFPCPNQSSH